MGSLVRSGRPTAVAKRSAAVVLALGMGGCQVAQLPPAAGGQQTSSPRSVIVQLFEWRWSDIAQECEAWLGPRGYGAVQISPPQERWEIKQEAINFSEQHYQPVGYTRLSRSGSRAELVDMISRCQRAGVRVYADMVVNPTAATCDLEPCGYDGSETAGHSALGTDSKEVQAEIAGAMNELLALGVAGFRIDSASQMSPQHLASILSRLHPLNPQFYPNGGYPFVYQEVDSTAEADAYFGNGAVTEFRYGRNLGEQVRYGQLKNLMLFGEAWGLIPSHKAVIFTDNPDTQRSRDRNIVSFYAPRDEGNSYRLANVFMLAWPYGIPKVMSSYDWSRTPGAGPPVDDQGQTLSVGCGEAWVCEHRWPDIASMVEFHNVTQGAPTVDHWWDNGNNQIAFARGDRGFVAINNEETALSETLMTGLPAGIYCNVLALPETGDASNGTLDTCEYETVEVDSVGNASIEVSPHQALALHVGARR
ncbi:MAG: alpha-amylase family protein [Cyanobacteria bacterium P01_H01_bin.26]